MEEQPPHPWTRSPGTLDQWAALSRQWDYIQWSSKNPPVPNADLKKAQPSAQVLLHLLQTAYPAREAAGGVHVRNDIMARVSVIGDLHGDIHALVGILEHLRDQGVLEKHGMKLVEGHHLLFTGDLVDRGVYGPAVMALVLKLKHRNPERVIWVLGNHDDSMSMWNKYGFASHVQHDGEEQLVELAQMLGQRVPVAVRAYVPRLPFKGEAAVTHVWMCHGLPLVDLAHGSISDDEKYFIQWARLKKGRQDQTEQWVPLWTSGHSPTIMRGHDHKAHPLVGLKKLKGASMELAQELWVDAPPEEGGSEPSFSGGAMRNDAWTSYTRQVTRRMIFTHTGSIRILRGIEEGDNGGYAQYHFSPDSNKVTATMWSFNHL